MTSPFAASARDVYWVTPVERKRIEAIIWKMTVRRSRPRIQAHLVRLLGIQVWILLQICRETLKGIFLLSNADAGDQCAHLQPQGSIPDGYSLLLIVALLPGLLTAFSTFPPSTKKLKCFSFQFDLDEMYILRGACP